MKKLYSKLTQIVFTIGIAKCEKIVIPQHMRIYIFFYLIMTLPFATVAKDRVLVIGDSHSVGPFGMTLDALLRKNSFSIYTAASCGSTLQNWMTGKETTCGFFSKDLRGGVKQYKTGPTPVFKTIFKQVQPQILLIQMGANYQYYNSPSEIRVEIKKFLEKYTSQVEKCIWVTHPDSRKYPEQKNQLATLIDEVVSPYCEVFHSYKVTAYPFTGGDGIHYSFSMGIPIAENWAKLVSKQFFNVE